MPLVAFTNTKDHTVYIGNKSIKPGQTREVEESLLPSKKADTVKEVEATNPLQDILAGNVDSVISAAADLSDDDLHLLQDMEDEAETPRKGVLEGLLKIALSRADLGAAE